MSLPRLNGWMKTSDSSWDCHVINSTYGYKDGQQNVILK